MIHQNQSSMVPPMKGSERRLTPRKAVETFAYINIEPSNGGSVLNLSEGGLCFHSIAPIQRSKTIRFWFREHHQRIEVQGDLVWMDETHKTAGLRFTDLPEEAREAMRKWTNLPIMPIGSDQAFPLSSLRRQNPAPGTSRLDTKFAPDSSEPPAVISQGARTQAPLTGFSGGLATGLLISALVVAPFLFRSYKHQLGESLIRWGEWFAARPHSQMQNVSPAPPAHSPLAQAVAMEPQAESPAPQTVAETLRTVLPAASPIPILQSEKLLPEHLKKTTSPQPTQLAHETPSLARPTAPPTLAPKAPAAVAPAAISTTASTITLPAASVASRFNVIPGKSVATNPVPANPVSANLAPASLALCPLKQGRFRRSNQRAVTKSRVPLQRTPARVHSYTLKWVSSKTRCWHIGQPTA